MLPYLQTQVWSDPVKEIEPVESSLTSSSSPDSPPFRLLDLTLEILDSIVLESIRSNDLAIMRTSQLLYERSLIFFPTNSVFRIKTRRDSKGYKKFEPEILPNQTAAMAQWVEMDLRIDPALFDNMPISRRGILYSFTGPERGQELRIIARFLGTVTGTTQLFDIIQQYTGFKTVVIEVPFYESHSNKEHLRTQRLKDTLY